VAKVLYLFNSSGEWIAFKIGKYLYNKNADWIGWFPWDNKIAVSIEGEYLGTIYKERRLLYNNSQPYLGYPGYPGYPGFIGYCALSNGLTDVPKKFLKEDNNG